MKASIIQLVKNIKTMLDELRKTRQATTSQEISRDNNLGLKIHAI
jgi:hypothetical protein